MELQKDQWMGKHWVVLKAHLKATISAEHWVVLLAERME
jgi:hypothetical protein